MRPSSRSTVVSLFVPLALVAVAPARGLEGPAMTTARELDLAAAHLATTALQQAGDGLLSAQAAETAAGFADLVRDFRLHLEPLQASRLEAESDWGQVTEGFLATRDLLIDNPSRSLQEEVRRVNALMNRLDRSFGGTGFWPGPNGWSG